MKLSAEQLLEVEKVVQTEIERRWEARVASAATALELAVQVGLERLKNAEVTMPPQIITKVGDVEHLGSPLAKLVEEHVEKRFSGNKNLVGSWIDERWDKKKEGMQRWISWAGLAGLLGVATLVYKMVSIEVHSEVQVRTPLAIKEEIPKIKLEAAKALKEGVEEQAAATKVMTERMVQENNALMIRAVDATTRSFDSRLSSATESLERLLREHPEFLHAFKERLELPLGTIIVVRREDVAAFLDRRLTWLSETAFDPTVAQWTLAKNGRSISGSRYQQEQADSTSEGLLKDMPELQTLPPPIPVPQSTNPLPEEATIREALNKLPALVPLIKINP